MSKLETNTIDTVSGTTNLVIGSTNTSTITMPNGALSGQNYPAFSVERSTNQSLTDGAATKISLDTITVDTDSAFDATTNYRFTVPSGKGGKYFIIGRATVQGGATGNAINTNLTHIYKNGSLIATGLLNAGSTHYFDFVTSQASIIVSLSASDYIELYVNSDAIGHTPRARGNDYIQGVTAMEGYRIGA